MENLAVNQQSEQIFQYLKWIPFRDLMLWDVKRLFVERIKSNYRIVSLEKFIQEETKKIRPKNYPENEHLILGVNNQVGIFDAYTQLGKEIKQPYKVMNTGFLAYNPYRVNIGSIGIKTDKHRHNLISPAYVVFSCKKELNSEYLFKLFKTQRFNQVIKENTTGSVRQNLTYQILQTLQIPLPSLSEQQSILARYNEKITKAEQLEQELATFNDRYQNILFEHLGIEIVESKQTKNKLRFVNFKDIERWSAFYLQNIDSVKGTLKAKYQAIKLKDLISGYQYGLSLKSHKNKKGNNLAFLRMNNIQEGELDTSDIKYVDYKDVDKKFELKQKDLLFNRTNSKELVGKTAVFVGSGNFTFASYLIRVNVDASKADVFYINNVLNSFIGRKQIDLLSRQILGQANINAQEMQELLIPLPPLLMQKKIVQELDKLVMERKAKQDQAKQLRQQAQQEFEQTVFLPSEAS